MQFEDFIRRRLHAVADARTAVADPEARYFGARLSERTLVPGEGAQLAAIRFDDWLSQQDRGN
jgi:hypothetical protein